MKMEVLSVQNQYQGQFGVIGSSKVKDWTSPLTPPPSQVTTTQQQQQQQQQQLKLNSGSDNEQQQKQNSIQQKPHQQQQHQQLPQFHKQPPHPQQQQEQNTKTSQGVDVVDGRLPASIHRNQQFYYNQQQLQPHTAMDAATASSVAPTGERHSRYAYNNNLLYCESAPALLNGYGLFGNVAGGSVDDLDSAAVTELSQRLQEEVRLAKRRHLACTEVSLPWDLMPRIAADIIRTSEREPCGVRGCTIFIEFEDEPNNIRRIATFKVDPNTVSTFELYLTLRQDKRGWTSLLPQFLKNLTRSSTILISPDFTLTKNKLYSCE